MKIKKLLVPAIAAALVLGSCTKDDVPKEPIVDGNGNEEEENTQNFEVEEFIYSGMEEIYLYKADVPELGYGFFPTTEAKEKFFTSFETPEDLFYDGLVASQDRFSFLVDDYVSLENSFKGVSTTNGMSLGLVLYSGDKVLAYVRYVLPNTSAEAAGIKRGDMFIKVDGVQMDENNYQDLLAKSSYEIEVAYLNGNTITSTGEKVTLTQAEYNSNPVYIVKTLDVEGVKVGYLMYNSFTSNYDDDLNAAFLELKNAGISELVLDLRYNGGGSVETAVDISSMITGQFENEIFMKEQWNEKYQNAWEPESYINRFNTKVNSGATINSLNLSKVYVLTTNRTASASELVINGLDPYINVVQVGGTTTGKFQASVTLYDSSNFGRQNANPNHTYAIQPLVLKSVNSAGKSDYVDGLTPDVAIEENLGALGTLGDPSEPLLNAALNHILGKAQKQQAIAKAKEMSQKFELIGETGMDSPLYQEMYIEELPAGLETRN